MGKILSKGMLQSLRVIQSLYAPSEDIINLLQLYYTA